MEKVKKSNPFWYALCNWPDSAVLHRPDSGSRKNAPAKAHPGADLRPDSRLA